jgi:hypothetical protein
MGRPRGPDDKLVTVTRDTTLYELTLMLARHRIRITRFSLDAFGEYFVQAQSNGNFYVGVSDRLHLAFAQIVDEIALTYGVKQRQREIQKIQTCKWCGVTAMLAKQTGERGVLIKRTCTSEGRMWCEPRARGERGPNQGPRKGSKAAEAEAREIADTDRRLLEGRSDVTYSRG